MAEGRAPRPFSLSARERFSRDTVVLYYQELIGRLTTGSIGTVLIHVHVATRFVAPDLRVAWLRPIISRLRRGSVSARRKKERLIASGELLRFGTELMREARTPALIGGHAGLLRHRDGLAMALLALRPLRLGNFLDVRIGVHLTNRFGVPWLCIAGAETKNRMDLEFPFPTELLEDLDHYLRVVRPRLASRSGRSGGQRCDHLWLSQGGKPLGRQTLYAMLKRRTLERFGKAVGPNLFRDCLATTMSAAG